MEVLGEMWTTAAISLSLYACIHQQAVVGMQDWTPTSFGTYLRQQILAYADVHGIL